MVHDETTVQHNPQSINDSSRDEPSIHRLTPNFTTTGLASLYLNSKRLFLLQSILKWPNCNATKIASYNSNKNTERKRRQDMQRWEVEPCLGVMSSCWVPTKLVLAAPCCGKWGQARGPTYRPTWGHGCNLPPTCPIVWAMMKRQWQPTLPHPAGKVYDKAVHSHR